MIGSHYFGFFSSSFFVKCVMVFAFVNDERFRSVGFSRAFFSFVLCLLINIKNELEEVEKWQVDIDGRIEEPQAVALDCQ